MAIENLESLEERSTIFSEGIKSFWKSNKLDAQNSYKKIRI